MFNSWYVSLFEKTYFFIRQFICLMIRKAWYLWFHFPVHPNAFFLSFFFCSFHGGYGSTYVKVHWEYSGIEKRDTEWERSKSVISASRRVTQPAKTLKKQWRHLPRYKEMSSKSSLYRCHLFWGGSHSSIIVPICSIYIYWFMTCLVALWHINAFLRMGLQVFPWEEGLSTLSVRAKRHDRRRVQLSAPRNSNLLARVCLSLSQLPPLFH